MTAADKNSSIQQILSASFIPETQSLNLTDAAAVTDQNVTKEASVEQIFRAVFDPATQALRATGGGSDIIGSIATNQVAFASAANTISGSNNFTWTNGTSTLTVTGNTSFSSIGANRMPFTNGSNLLTGSANYTVNGTGGLTIAQTLTATGGAFAAGVSGFNITGTNAACNVGTNFNLAQAGSSGAFFSGTATGDAIIRQINTGLSVNIGVGSGSPQLQITNTAVNFRVNPSIISTINPALNIASNTNFAQVTAAASFFSNTAIGDTIVRQTDTSKTIRLGVTLSGSSQLDISSSTVVSNVPIVVAGNGTFSGGTVTSAAVNTGAIQATLLVMDDTNITQATSDGQFFTDVLTGDTVIANTDSARAIRLGVGSSTDARLVIATNTILSTANLFQTNGDLVVGGYLTLSGTLSALGDMHVGSGGAQSSAIVIVDSTTQGFLPPRMTTTQKNAISTPASGLIVYDTTLGKLCVRGAAAWETITSV